MEKYFVLDNSLNQNDSDLMDDFISWRSYSDYIGDAISEIADSRVSVYNSEICDNCWGLYVSGAYEEASVSGLCEGSDDLIRNLQMAWYYYNEQQLYNNLPSLIYNLAMSYAEDENIELSVDEEEELEGFLEDIDNNNTFNDIIEAVDAILDKREEELEEELEDELEEELEEE